jgi:hypothetical protein
MPHRGPIVTSDPVDRSHPLNVGRVAWFLSLPHLAGGRRWYDVLGRHTGTFGTDGSNFPAWGATNRLGGTHDLRFDGLNYATPADLSGRFGGPGATLACWIKCDLATPVDENKTGLWDLDSGSGIQNTHYPWTDGTVYIGTFRTSRVSFANSSFDKSRWHHLAVTTKPGTDGYIVYQNGEVAYSTTGQATAVINAAARIGFSTVGTGFGFSGRMDGLALWDYALPQALIRADYELGLAGYPGVLRRVRRPVAVAVGAAAPSYTAAAALVAAPAVLAASATRTPPAYAAAVALVAAPAALTATATASTPVRSATAALVAAPAILAASATASGGAATITSAASGDWGTGSTWTGGVAPTAIDTAIIATGHTVTVGDARTCAGWTQQGSGVLAIAGTGTLTSTGDTMIEGDSADTAKVTIAAGGSLLWDPGTGVTITHRTGADYYRFAGIQANGTSTDRCTVGKAEGAAGTLVWRHGDGFIWMQGILTATYTDFEGWGTSGVDAVELYPRWHGDFILDHCEVRECGRWNLALYNFDGGSGYTGECTLTDTRWTDSLGSECLIITGNGDGTGATVERCDFDKQVYFVGNHGGATPGPLVLEDCIFRGPLTGSWAAAYTTSSGHFLHNTTAQDHTFPATHTDCYQFIDYTDLPDGGNPHFWAPNGAATLEDCVFEYRGPYNLDTGDVFMQSFGDCAMRRCIILPSSVAGKTSGDTAWFGGGVFTVEHCTFYVGDYDAVLFPHGVAMGADRIVARSNIFWTDSGGSGFHNDGPELSDLDALAPDSVTDNAFCGLGTFDNVVGGVTTPLVGFDACEFSVAPTGNLELATDGPAFVDETRDFLGWARTVRGHSGTDDQARDLAVADIEADRTLVRLSLIPWVRAGFAPQNAALDGAAHDFTTIGAVAYQAPPAPVTRLLVLRKPGGARLALWKVS